MVIDAGTSCIRCHIVDNSGHIVKTQQVNWPESVMDERLPLAREFNPKQISNAIYSLINKTTGSLDLEIKSVAVTGMRQAITVLDRHNHEIYIGPNIDLRAIFEGSEIDSKHGAEIYATTGRLPSFLFANAKLEWIKRHYPEKYNRIEKVIPLADWIVWILSGEIIAEMTNAGEAGLLNISNKTWSQDLSKLLSLPTNRDVPLLNIGDVAGKVTKRVSELTNLPFGIEVTSAGADTQCGSLGLGVIKPNDVSIISGWSSPIQWVTETPISSQDASNWFGCHALENYWVSELTAGDTGHSYNWIAKILRQNPKCLDDMAKEIEPGAEGTSIVFAKEEINMSEIGIDIGGILFPTPITMNERSDGHIARAALESISYTIKARISQIARIIGKKPSEIYLGGGMARSDTFTQIIADILNMKINIADTYNANAMGGFIAGIVALNEYSSLTEAATEIKSLLSVKSPNPSNALEYKDLYDNWKKTSAKLNSINT
ncbi:MAG: hypothetical protein CL904_03750 [Dehalococcoidia bacterium]|nr:hypothetical protein [Dehalococcoidia bacterium]MQG15817.1 hypothetical protein [SAR202 cluster bacterium]